MYLRAGEETEGGDGGAYTVADEDVRTVRLVPAAPVAAVCPGGGEQGLTEKRYLPAMGVSAQREVKPALVAVLILRVQRL